VFQTEISNLSGYINSSNSNIVFTTGNQRISGTKTFTNVTETFLTLDIDNETINFPLNSGMNFIIPLTTSITGITFLDTPSNTTYSFTLRIDYSGDYSIIWPIGTPGGILWPNDTAPTLTSVSQKTDLFTFLTYDGGNNFYGFVSAQNF
jgi:hypothetical protein